MIHLLVLLLALLGFAALCAGRDRHQADLLGRKLPVRSSRILRWSGALLLGLAFVIAGSGLGWGYGGIEWLGQLSVAAAAVVLWLTRAAARRKRT